MLQFSKLFSFLTIIGAVIGVFVIYIGMTQMDTIMQEIGAITFALALVIFPYCVSKVMKDLAEPEDISNYYIPERNNNVVAPTLNDIVNKPSTAFTSPNAMANAVADEQRTSNYRMGKVEELPTNQKSTPVMY